MNKQTFKLTVGDSSGSHSERWNLEVFEEATGRPVIRHCDNGFGTPGSRDYALVKGKAYTFKLRWIVTDPLQPDTDGDGLPDGWELAHGMDPLVNNDTDGIEGNGAQDDPDSDGLNNQAESDHDTDPNDADTDGDLVSDGDEVAQGSDPLDPDDHDPRETVTVTFTFGDPSGSHSEKYRLTVAPVSGDPRPAQAIINHTYGVCDTLSLVLVKGAKYTVSLDHVSTDPDFMAQYGFSNCDWLLDIESSQGGVLVDDPDNIVREFAGWPNSTFLAAGKHATLYVLKMDLVPDYNRNGTIEEADRTNAKAGEVFRFWVNDDYDVGDTAEAGGTDIPGQTTIKNCGDMMVNGRRDLLDFFPVMVDVPELAMLVNSGHTLRLRHSDAAIHFMHTKLGNLNAGWYLTHDVGNCGFGMHEPARSAALLQATAEGTQMSPIFVTWIKNTGGKGVLLVEGMAASAAPLVLEAVKDGAAIVSAELPLRIAPVEEMYDRVNLHNGPAAVTPGSALPPANGKNVIFLHGFKVAEQEACAWNAEMFKRLWQSGSAARFHGVTWFGNDGVGNGGLNYHGNVVHAFEAAPHLRDYVSSLSGEKTVMAHSLGNMVVSSAIADHGMGVGRYFMLNAAVPAEAYDPGLWNDSPDTSNRLVHDYWRSYANGCWCAKWHGLFTGDPTDDRRHLTWKSRFADVLASSSVYNFYSSGGSANDEDGDEVFELSAVTPVSLDLPLGRYSWQKQETHKGRGTLDPAGTSWAGWEFAEHEELVIASPPTYATVRDYSAAEANATNAANPLAFAESPVFRKNPPEMFTNSIPAALRNELLAKGIPALSPAAGNANVAPDTMVNFNMNLAFKPSGGAWGRDHVDYGKRWLHSDMKDMAYYYVHGLFGALVTEGALQ